MLSRWVKKNHSAQLCYGWKKYKNTTGCAIVIIISRIRKFIMFSLFGKAQKRKIFVTFVFPSSHPFLLAFLFLVGCSFRHHKIKIKIGRNHVQLAMIYSELFLSVFPFFFFYYDIYRKGQKTKQNPPKKCSSYWLSFFLLFCSLRDSVYHSILYILRGVLLLHDNCFHAPCVCVCAVGQFVERYFYLFYISLKYLLYTYIDAEKMNTRHL